MDERARLIERRDRAFGTGAALFYEEPLALDRGDGVWLFDVDGTRYLDLYNNVPCVGHANERVAAAIADQARTLNVHNRYLHDGAVDYAERLLALHHDGIESLVMACSGTEAVELAVRMAQTATGRRGMVCTDATYHGNSTQVGAMTRLATGSSRNGAWSIATPQLYRPIESGRSEEELCELHLEQLSGTLRRVADSDDGIAGMILCSIFANEGLPVVPADFFNRATALVREAGGVVIADEVQAGFGRTGRWWGYETSGFEPDIVVMGKPMGNGMPVSAAAASHQIVSGFRTSQGYFNTFASSPLQAAAASAVLDEIIDRELVAQAGVVGEQLRQRLLRLQTVDPRMGDVRGHGLFLGVEWVRPGTNTPDVPGATRMVEALKARGMLIGAAGQHRNVLKFRPPLVFDSAHADLFLEAFEAALTDVVD
ncbi:MAG: aminotransferase class III-fold pyridoxal phosphate-dependent enzyme [Acidimicrobiales bacterium]|jgi:4-aminobutyrate aminotransferase-like enzyme|nr:aminotransferase class III-fold pyridoxal phosphate-dependent enzyme [Acidimicrobiales bacterium]